MPPAPAPAKKIPSMRVEGSVTRTLDGKRLTVLRGEPSALPEIPRQIGPVVPTLEEAADRNARAAARSRTVLLQIGATVYDHRVSVVHWRHPHFPEIAYEAVAGLDFGLFAGVVAFTHEEVAHSLILAHSNATLTAIRPIGGRQPDLPEVANEAHVIVKGDPTDAAGMHPFTALMDLYAAEKVQLVTAHAARLRYLRDADAWRKANPAPEPAQRTFWLRPHRGSRYLKNGGAR